MPFMPLLACSPSSLRQWGRPRPDPAVAVSVAAAAIFDVGPVYVVRGGLPLIHTGETIIPTARGRRSFHGRRHGSPAHAPCNQ